MAKTSTNTIDAAAYDAAMQALAESEARFRTAQQRLADLDARGKALADEAADLERQRGKAFAVGEVEEAAKLGKLYAKNREEASSAGHAVTALRGQMDDLMIALYQAERIADDAHMAIFRKLVDDLEAEFAATVKPLIVRLWRARQAADLGLPYDFLWRDLGQMLDDGDGQRLDASVDFPAIELSPRSALLGPGNPRRPIGFDNLRIRLAGIVETRKHADSLAGQAA